MLFKWFKRKNATSEVDNEKGTTKINAADVSVEVDGKKVTVAELEEAMMVKEAEESEEKKLKELEHEQVNMDENVVLSNGKEYKIGALVENWKVKQAKKNSDDAEKAKAEEEKKNALKARANACGMSENATEEEVVAKEKEIEKKNAEEAEAKKKAEEEAKAKEESEKKENAKKTGSAFFKELHNASQNQEILVPVSSGIKSRTERAADWAKKNQK